MFKSSLELGTVKHTHTLQSLQGECCGITHTHYGVYRESGVDLARLSRQSWLFS